MNREILNECYFIPRTDITSATICANCGKEKMLHTTGKGIRATKIIITTTANKEGK